MALAYKDAYTIQYKYNYTGFKAFFNTDSRKFSTPSGRLGGTIWLLFVFCDLGLDSVELLKEMCLRFLNGSAVSVTKPSKLNCIIKLVWTFITGKKYSLLLYFLSIVNPLPAPASPSRRAITMQFLSVVNENILKS